MAFIILCPNKCGSTSLCNLLNKVDGLECKHERSMRPLPYIQDYDLLNNRIKNFTKNYGEVGFYYLYYLPEMLSAIPNLKVVVLKRGYSSWLKSFTLFTGGNFKITGKYKNCYPPYHKKRTEHEMWRFYHEYYIRVYALKKLTKNIEVFDMDCLNSVEGLDKIYSHIGVPKNKRIYKFIHDNATTY